MVGRGLETGVGFDYIQENTDRIKGIVVRNVQVDSTSCTVSGKKNFRLIVKRHTYMTQNK